MQVNKSRLLQVVLAVVKAIVCVACVGVTVWGAHTMLIINPAAGQANATDTSDYLVMDRYDKYIINSFSEALEGVMSISRVYWLSDSDLVAPEPDPACYGETSNPKDLEPVIAKAQNLLDGQELVFSTDVELAPDSVIRYYYDPSILAITWQVVIDNSIYSMSEVKISDGSQLRRFLSDGRYAAGTRYLCTEMADTVNAVVAVNGDYYDVRHIGPTVYNRQLMRMEGYRMDSCMIDGDGDLNFVRAGEIVTRSEMEQYVQREDIRFSLAFGPVIVDNGELVDFKSPYCVGEVHQPNDRAALCQKDKLHYLVVIANGPYPYEKHLLSQFAKRVQEMGVQKAYNIDGGRSGVLVINNKKVNEVHERELSDIIYFATAISSED